MTAHREVQSIVAAHRESVSPGIASGRLRPATVDELLAAPVGRYASGRSFVVWVHSPTLCGSAYWGRPDASDFPALIQLYALPRHPDLRPPFDVLIDCAGLAALDVAAFEMLNAHLVDVARTAANVRRVSIVRPEGLDCATLAGVFHELVGTVFPAALFTERAEALRWLGRVDATARCAIDDMLDGVRNLAPPLRQLRGYLAHHLEQSSVDAAARALGVSQRSLQRRLLELGTSFRDELARARVSAAEALLIDSDAKLETVARHVGCSSLPQFSALFRRMTGETPSEFRTRRRS